ncbi:EpsG family protein [Photobacterium damselae]|uniref:EpsG family protein n=1 Tax=Photobacterium damselae TaxID=38293 RepID=UPI003D7E7B57
MLNYISLSGFIIVSSLAYIASLRSNNHVVRLVIYFFLVSIFTFIATLYGFRRVDYLYGGSDTIAYLNTFHNLDLSNFFSIFEQRMEKGYVFLMWLFKTTTGSFALFLSFIFSLIYLFFLKICKEITLNYFTIFSISIFSLFFIDSFNITRMIIGSFLTFISIICLSNGDVRKSILYVLLGSLFQLVSLWGGIFIIYYLIVNKYATSKLKYLLLNVLLLLISYFSIRVFSSVLTLIGYGHYLTGDINSFSPLNYIYLTLILIGYFFLWKNDIDNKVSNTIFLLLPTMYFVIPLYLNFQIAYRFNYVYMLCFAFILPDICSACLKSKGYILKFLLLLPLSYASIKYYSYFVSSMDDIKLWGLLPSWYIL